MLTLFRPESGGHPLPVIFFEPSFANTFYVIGSAVFFWVVGNVTQVATLHYFMNVTPFLSAVEIIKRDSAVL